MEELTNLVSTKDEGIKNMERRLLQAKKVIADLKAEVQSLRSHNDLQESDHQQQTPQQQSETEIGRVSSHNLSTIHSRYQKVLQVISDNRCSMANEFRLAGCPRSTVRDFVAIAELKNYQIEKEIGLVVQARFSAITTKLRIAETLERERESKAMKYSYFELNNITIEKNKFPLLV